MHYGTPSTSFITSISQPPAKRSTLRDITNKIDEERWKTYSPGHWFPLAPIIGVPNVPDLGPEYAIQNIHPILPFYKYDMLTETMSHDQLCTLLAPDKERELLNLLMETRTVAKEQQCKFCGGSMSIKKQGEYWYWICQRRVNGVKCKTKANILYVMTHSLISLTCLFRTFFGSCGTLCIIFQKSSAKSTPRLGRLQTKLL